ncbi:DUF4333 domain-containing protein [Mycobacterium sp. E802]|uniref:DUF4333 domain-containing protein n=1 Tax=Mycobacterium sp. E802 TaxID=1834152 RepID=UPI000A4631A5|nr:DUF4333 domain-containing protein [Mycobacterium sp. E802]
MSGPEQPWWVRPGGAPPPGTGPARPAWTPPGPPPQPVRRTQVPPPRRVPQPPARPPAPPQPRTVDRRVLVGAVAVVTVAVIGVGLWAWNGSEGNGTRLDVRQAEAGVAEILSDPINGYGANRVAAVACNNGDNPVVRTGATFECAVEINDTLRRVIVEFTDDEGTYAVDGPR